MSDMEKWYRVFAIGDTALTAGRRAGLTLEEAEAHAKSVSEANAPRSIGYVLTEHEGEGPSKGLVVSLWIRGHMVEPDALPRAEVREHYVGADKKPVAVFPVVDGDENWSLNAAGVITLHMTGGYVVLVDKDGLDVKVRA